MFRKSKVLEMSELFASQLEKNSLTVFYFDVSGFLVRNLSQTVMIDPAGFLKDEEVRALKTLNLLLFTHDHLDHFRTDKAQAIFKSTATAVLAEPKVANKLKGKIPSDKLTSAKSGETYAFGDITVTAIQGIHQGPIMLYQIKMGGIKLFHAGDSGYVNLKDYPSDVAFLPTGRMSPTASPENAYKMATDLKPRTIIAMHGSENQKEQLLQKVKENMPNTEVMIMKPYTTQTISL
jgi:L-ascorbate metabolism protein UlaG (beta-lactamase superfamily)